MSLSVEGHARFDNEAGGDIVCSAVSALVGFLGIIFSEVLPGRGELGAEDGQFWLKIFPEFQEEPEVSAVLRGWVLSLRQLEENYQGWVKLEESFDRNLEQQ